MLARKTAAARPWPVGRIIELPVTGAVTKKPGEKVYFRVVVRNGGDGTGNFALLGWLYDAAAGSLTDYTRIEALGSNRYRRIRWPASGYYKVEPGATTEFYGNFGTVPISTGINKYHALVYIAVWGDPPAERLYTQERYRLVTDAVAVQVTAGLPKAEIVSVSIT